MKRYDISQEIFSCAVFPGDPAPRKETLASLDEGDLYQLTAFSMCAHNGTHIDAPFHFLPKGKTVDQLSLTATVGYAYVASHSGPLTAADAEAILARAEAADREAARRLLLKGDLMVTPEAAAYLAERRLLLLGNESQTVGPEEAPAQVHRLLLGADTVLLEGIRLAHVPDGVYLMLAAPLSLGGCEGAPCRAVLLAL